VIGSPYMSLIITVFAIVLVMNAINFIDGLDGLVAGVARSRTARSSCTRTSSRRSDQPERLLQSRAVISAVLIGACVGFLPFELASRAPVHGRRRALLVGLLMAASTVTVTTNLDLDAITGTGGATTHSARVA